MNLEQLRKDKREAILAIAARHGARNVRVFGSVARGEVGPDSDVDFLVDLDQDRDLFDLGALLMDLQDLLGCKVETVTEPALHGRIRGERPERGGAAVKDDRVYLEHILEAIARIEAYTAGGREVFMAETLIQDAVLRNLQTLTE